MTALARSERFLRDILGDGPVDATRVAAEARSLGIAEVTLRRARRSLGVRAVRVGGLGAAGRWVNALASHSPKTLSDEWRTPPEVFGPLDREFSFVLDVAATAENARCAEFFAREDDALRQSWYGPAWMNPPYSEQGRWVEKAAHECDQRGVLVVALLRAATDARYWHEHIGDHRHVRWVRGRIRFEGPKRGSPPFASAVVVFRPGGAR